jgi:D-alanyl-D-alanine carboxypeptidase
MIGRPERTQTKVRLVRRAPPRERRSHALPLSITILAISVFVAASFTRATGSGVALIGPWDPPVMSTSPKGTTSAPPATSVAPVPSSSPIATMPQLPACRYADEPAAHTAYHDWQRTIVDTMSRLPKVYAPPDLVAVSRAGLSGGGSIRRIAIADLRALAKAGRTAGVRLAVESAYRGEARQRSTFAGWVRTSGEAEAKRFSARAGHSEHQLGTAIDFKAAGGGSPWTQAFARSRHALWLAANAWRFGWIQSYPMGAEAQTCYGDEAWHYRYVGRDVAAEVHASGMTLRGWLWIQAIAD